MPIIAPNAPMTFLIPVADAGMNYLFRLRFCRMATPDGPPVVVAIRIGIRDAVIGRRAGPWAMPSHE